MRSQDLAAVAEPVVVAVAVERGGAEPALARVAEPVAVAVALRGRARPPGVADGGVDPGGVVAGGATGSDCQSGDSSLVFPDSAASGR